MALPDLHRCLAYTRAYTVYSSFVAFSKVEIYQEVQQKSNNFKDKLEEICYGLENHLFSHRAKIVYTAMQLRGSYPALSILKLETSRVHKIQLKVYRNIKALHL